MSMNLPKSPVLDKVFANNSRVSPNATSNNTVVDHKNFSMAHPQKVDANTLNGLLGNLNLDSPSQQSNGSIKGTTKDGGTFHLTPGVLKFKKGKKANNYPPAASGNQDKGGQPASYQPPTAAADTTMNQYYA